MTQLTIELPDELATRLQPMRNRLVEVIEQGLYHLTPSESSLDREVIEFLACGPSQQEIIAFRPSEKTIERVRTLLDQNQKNMLTTTERAELDQVERLNYLMTMIKAHARRQLNETR